MHEKIDLTQLKFSLAILRPRAAFFDWLGPVISRQGFEISQVYFPDEDGVWLIPSLGTSGSTDEFHEFLNGQKPNWVKMEMGKFGAKVSDLPQEFNSQFCDSLFEFEIRHSVNVTA